MSLLLRRITIEDEPQIRAAIQEFDSEEGHWSYRFRPDLPWDEYVALVHGWEDGINLPERFVKHAELVAEVDGDVVGRTSIRFEMNEFLSTLGGHIGYAVRPKFRRQGYATEILRQSLEIARARGIDPVLVTCDDDNLASAKVIEANGGKLENIIPGELPDMPMKRRYWC